MSRSAVYRLIEAGELTAYKVRGRLRVEPAEVEAFKRRNRVRPRSRHEQLIFEPLAIGEVPSSDRFGAEVRAMRRSA
jgi:excisionase family DNA binding protein